TLYRIGLGHNLGCGDQVLRGHVVGHGFPQYDRAVPIISHSQERIQQVFGTHRQEKGSGDPIRGSNAGPLSANPLSHGILPILSMALPPMGRNTRRVGRYARRSEQTAIVPRDRPLSIAPVSRDPVPLWPSDGSISKWFYRGTETC